MQFPLIDVARGFAALSVLVFHFLAHWQWDDFPSSGPLQWFRNGWMAVDIFFVISGFVIGLSAFGRIDAQGRDFRGGFLRSRLARIAPLHVLTLFAFVALVEPSLVSKADFGPDLLAHLAFVHNLVLPWYGSINGPNWSLGAEMQFYLLVALAAPWLRRVRPWIFVALFFATAWAWRWGAWSLTIPGSFDTAYYAQTQLPGMLDEFAIGLLLARFVRTAGGQALLARLSTDARLRHGLLLVTALSWWALFEVFQANHFWHEAGMAVFFRTALGACAALVLLLLCAWPMPQRRGLVAVPLYLGKVSYGIYLWHLPVLILLARHTQLAPLAAVFTAIGATVALAALTWHGVEQPLLRRWGAGKKTAASQRPELRTAQAAARRRVNALVETDGDTHAPSSVVPRA